MAWDEREIKRLFEKRRRSDAQIAPPFDRLIRRPLRRSIGRPAFRPVWVAAGLTVIAAVLWIAVHRTPQAPETLAHWSPPTEFLLDYSGASVYAWPPREWITITPAWGLSAPADSNQGEKK